MSQLVKAKNSETAKAWFALNHDRIARAIPRGVSADRLLQVAINAIAGNEGLERCSRASVIGAVLQANSLGLELNTVLGHAYLVPFKGKAQLIAGYRGYAYLALRNADIIRVDGDIVREGELLKITRGMHSDLIHEPDYDNLDAPIKGAYGLYETGRGGGRFWYMTIDQIHKRRACSPAFRKGYGPWVDWYEEMVQKTAYRGLFKIAPINVESARLTELDEQHDLGKDQDFGEVIDTVGVALPPEDGQAIEPGEPSKTEPGGMVDAMFAKCLEEGFDKQAALKALGVSEDKLDDKLAAEVLDGWDDFCRDYLKK